jgi:hypothetical protein
MRTRPARTALLPLLLCGALACGSGAAPGQAGFGDTPLLQVASASGALTLAVYSKPDPPIRGNVAVRYRITDPGGRPVDGLVLSVVPWMVSMGHGTSIVPSVAPAGGGVYDIRDAYLFMPGQWQLRTTITGATSDSAAPDLLVQ